MTFQQKLDNIMQRNNSLVCVGLDSDFEKLPEHIKKLENPQFAFNKAIIDATHDLVCAYKPNSAFYEALGDRGVVQLKMTCYYLRETYSEISIILDAKRGDIGSSNVGYAKYAFEYLQVDALTVIPYFGIEALEAFFNYYDRGIIIGCHSSNPGAIEFQELLIDDKPLYHIVAEKIKEKYTTHNNVMLFVGATFPDQLGEVRKIVGDMIILSPGIGAQEGALKRAVTLGLDSQKKGLIINSSRDIIFAAKGEDFAAKARIETMKLRNEINNYRNL